MDLTEVLSGTYVIKVELSVSSWFREMKTRSLRITIILLLKNEQKKKKKDTASFFFTDTIPCRILPIYVCTELLLTESK